MNFKLVIGLVLVLVVGCIAMTVIAVDPKNLSAEDINAIWPGMWQSYAPGGKVPAVDPLSRQQVISEMDGTWSVRVDGDRDFVALGINGEASLSGMQNGKRWKIRGEWKVISNKLVLFLPGEEFPDFIFFTKGKPHIFNPWANSSIGPLMSEMQRLAYDPAPPSTRSGRQARQVLASTGRISKEQVLAILKSMDDASLNNNSAAAVAHFSKNAIITAAVVEGRRTDTSTNDPDSFRRVLESGFNDFDNVRLQRKNISVWIARNGRNATSRSTIVERFDVQGNEQQSTTRESARFEVIDGKICITQMDSKVLVK